MTWNSRVLPIPAGDYIFNHTLYARYNPNNAPASQDICVRQVPLGKIRPELLEKNRKGEETGKLVEAFCAGIWGGVGKCYVLRLEEGGGGGGGRVRWDARGEYGRG